MDREEIAEMFDVLDNGDMIDKLYAYEELDEDAMNDFKDWMTKEIYSALGKEDDPTID